MKFNNIARSNTIFEIEQNAVLFFQQVTAFNGRIGQNFIKDSIKYYNKHGFKTKLYRLVIFICLVFDSDCLSVYHCLLDCLLFYSDFDY